MTAYQLQRSSITPYVVLDPAANRLVLEGDCYPENPAAFFAPILRAVEAHLGAARPPSFVADFHLRYVNSASTVTLHRLFTLLDAAGKAGGAVRINWAHDADDDVNEELGHDLSRGCRYAEVVHRVTAEG